MRKAASYGAAGRRERRAGDQNYYATAAKSFQRLMYPGRAGPVVEVERGAGEARDAIGVLVGAQCDDDIVGLQRPAAGPDRPRVAIDVLNIRPHPLDALLVELRQVVLSCRVWIRLARHHAQVGRAQPQRFRSLDDRDRMLRRQQPAQMGCGHQAADAAPEDKGRTSVQDIT